MTPRLAEVLAIDRESQVHTQILLCTDDVSKRLTVIPASVVISSLEEVYSFVGDTVHHPVFLSNTTRPAACEHVSQRLGLPRPLERIAHCGVHQIQHSDCGATFVFDPKTKVLPELRLKDRDPLRTSLHPASLDEVPQRFQAWSAALLPGLGPTEDAVHFAVTATNEQSRAGRRVRWLEAGPRPALPAGVRSPFPAHPPPDRERWTDWREDSYTSFHSACDTHSYCTGFLYGSAVFNLLRYDLTRSMKWPPWSV
jgi:hypothetical protein